MPGSDPQITMPVIDVAAWPPGGCSVRVERIG